MGHASLSDPSTSEWTLEERPQGATEAFSAHPGAGLCRLP